MDFQKWDSKRIMAAMSMFVMLIGMGRLFGDSVCFEKKAIIIERAHTYTIYLFRKKGYKIPTVDYGHVYPIDLLYSSHCEYETNLTIGR